MLISHLATFWVYYLIVAVGSLIFISAVLNSNSGTKWLYFEHTIPECKDAGEEMRRRAQFWNFNQE